MNARFLQTIGAADHPLVVRDMKVLSGMDTEARDGFWVDWMAIPSQRRAEVTRTMVEFAEDTVELDFCTVFFWCLDDPDAVVRANAIEGLWEQTSVRVLRRLLMMVRDDPASGVRSAAAIGLSRFAYLATVGELDEQVVPGLCGVLRACMLDQGESLDVRRRALESAGYFAEDDEVQREVALAFASDEVLLRESALVAMGRSMLPRWLPTIAEAMVSRSPALRYEAARAAGEMAEEARSLVPRLVRLLNDDDSEVALMAIWALGQVGGAAARRALEQVRKGRDEARRQAAVEALEELALGDDSFGGD